MRKTVLTAVIVLVVLLAWLIVARGTARQCLIVGLVLVVAGVPLLVLARFQLGKAFAVMPKAKALVSSGLYARIPHPLYVFLDIALLGLVIAMRQRWLLVLWLVLVAVHAGQAAREARVLEHAFGDRYRQYRAQTWW